MPERIDNEPAMIHPFCKSGCGMNKADNSNQCGDGCILITVYGESSGVSNPRYEKPLVGLAALIAHPPPVMEGEPAWIPAAREWEAQPPWKKRIKELWLRLNGWKKP